MLGGRGERAAGGGERWRRFGALDIRLGAMLPAANQTALPMEMKKRGAAPLFLQEFHHRLRAVVDAEFFKDVPHVLVNGMDADGQVIRDVLVGIAPA